MNTRSRLLLGLSVAVLVALAAGAGSATGVPDEGAAGATLHFGPMLNLDDELVELWAVNVHNRPQDVTLQLYDETGPRVGTTIRLLPQVSVGVGEQGGLGGAWRGLVQGSLGPVVGSLEVKGKDLGPSRLLLGQPSRLLGGSRASGTAGPLGRLHPERGIRVHVANVGASVQTATIEVLSGGGAVVEQVEVTVDPGLIVTWTASVRPEASYRVRVTATSESSLLATLEEFNIATGGTRVVVPAA